MKEYAVEDAAKIFSVAQHEPQSFQILSPETLAPITESKQNYALAASAEANRIELDLIQKEDRDFEITEALFMESLGLGLGANSHSNLSRS